MIDEEIRTIPLSLESTVNGITVSIPWAQRQANGAVILRVHMQSARHTAGELLLNEGDLIALDPDERPLRTQVRRFWGYSALTDITAAHLQTARFDVGFRLDLVATRGQGGLSISIIRSFRPGEGPRAVGGPWVFKFRVVDESEIASLARAEALRIEAAQREQAQREAAQRDAAERDAAQREAARLARARAEADRGPLRTERTAASSESRGEPRDLFTRAGDADGDEYAAGRGRRSSRFGRPERRGRDEDRRDLLEPPVQRVSPATVEPPATEPVTAPTLAGTEEPGAEPAPAASRRANFSRGRGSRAAGAAERVIEDAVMGPAEVALEAAGERPPEDKPGTATEVAAVADGEQEAPARPAARARTARPAARRASRPATRKEGDGDVAPPDGADENT